MVDAMALRAVANGKNLTRGYTGINAENVENAENAESVEVKKQQQQK